MVTSSLFKPVRTDKNRWNRLKPMRSDRMHQKSTKSISLSSTRVGFLIIQPHFNNTKSSFFLCYFLLSVFYHVMKVKGQFKPVMKSINEAMRNPSHHCPTHRESFGVTLASSSGSTQSVTTTPPRMYPAAGPIAPIR